MGKQKSTPFWPPLFHLYQINYCVRNCHNFWKYYCLSPLALWVRIPLRRGVLDTTLCDKVCQWLTAAKTTPTTKSLNSYMYVGLMILPPDYIPLQWVFNLIYFFNLNETGQPTWIQNCSEKEQYF